MLKDIEAEAAYASFQTKRKTMDPRVMEAMASVPRHQFVSQERRGQAYEDRPLPIAFGQTISQPFIVALMTDLLNLEQTDRVLEVGTGSGYQAAVLGQLVHQVYSLEIIPTLSEQAQERFRRLDYGNIHCKISDGYGGWPEEAPFDGIIVTAASPIVPAPLTEQLKAGGRLVIPLGDPAYYQELVLLEKDEQGQVTTQDILGVSFVPLTRSSG
jgi:protein-L-isoaspartate(D-aspartate) O-methyltransferase